MEDAKYADWTPQQLIARIRELEARADKQTAPTTPAPQVQTPLPTTTSTEGVCTTSLPLRKPPKAPPKSFDFSKYSSRLIALKFAYLGQRYNGFEHHKNNRTPLPTVEEELWKALVKTRLINPIPTAGEDGKNQELSRITQKQIESWEREGADVNWDGCEYSKCGRTDRGVSAFGQVIGIRVRSNRPVPNMVASGTWTDANSDTTSSENDTPAERPNGPMQDVEGQETSVPEKLFDPIADEIPYIQLLNRVLPPDIRILAWCPNPPPNFSARFSCKERRYKYFFTNPCFTPVPGLAGLYKSPIAEGVQHREGWLNIDAMQEGCRNLIGLHDFRNFCKIDVSKQITNFQRRIYYAGIEEISPLAVPRFLADSSLLSLENGDQPKMYAFVLHGSAFLWHQVRSIVAILFRIGQGLESPDLVKELLDINANPTRPKYEMASDAPLVLWDCIFPAESEVQSAEERETGYQDSLEWIYAGEKGGEEKSGKAGIGRGKWGRGGLMDDLWEVWRGQKMEECLAGSLMDVVAAQGKGVSEDEHPIAAMGRGVRIFDGADFGRSKGNYTRIMKMERTEPVEVLNERYAKKKGWDPAKPRVMNEDPDE